MLTARVFLRASGLRVTGTRLGSLVLLVPRETITHEPLSLRLYPMEIDVSYSERDPANAGILLTSNPHLAGSGLRVLDGEPMEAFVIARCWRVSREFNLYE